MLVPANARVCHSLPSESKILAARLLNAELDRQYFRSIEAVRTKTKNRGKSYDNKNKNFLKTLGPGLITGASDDDPSGIGTYSQAGAQLGFGIGWTMLLTYPLMVAIQEISARIGRVTGHGIAGNVCRHFPKPLLWALLAMLFVANTVNIAADLGAMADALNLLIGGPRIAYVVA